METKAEKHADIIHDLFLCSQTSVHFYRKMAGEECPDRNTTMDMSYTVGYETESAVNVDSFHLN